MVRIDSTSSSPRRWCRCRPWSWLPGRCGRHRARPAIRASSGPPCSRRPVTGGASTNEAAAADVWESLMRGSLTGTPTPADVLVECERMAGGMLRGWQSRCPRRFPRGDPGIPGHAAGQGHPGTSRAAALRRRAPTGQRAAPRGGRPARRHLQRVLHPAGARQRHRRLRERHRGHRARTPARRRRTDPPARPPARRRHDPSPTAPPRPAAPPAHGAAGPGLDERHTAFVLNGRGDILAANHLGRALFSPGLRGPGATAQQRPVHLPQPARAQSPRWDEVADDAVAMLRAKAGRDLYDRRLTDLIGELPPAARSSGAAGPRTTSACTPPA